MVFINTDRIFLEIKRGLIDDISNILVPLTKKEMDDEFGKQFIFEAKKVAPRDLGAGIDSIEMRGNFIYGKSYMQVLDQGADPWTLNPDPKKLEEWGQRKIGVKGLGYRLAKSIRKKGLRPRHWVRISAARVFYKQQRPLRRRMGLAAVEALRKNVKIGGRL